MRRVLRGSAIVAVIATVVMSLPISSVAGSTATRSNRLNCSGSCANGSHCTATGSGCTCDCDFRGNARCTCLR